MARTPERRPLGRGLSALLDDPGDDLAESTGANEFPIDLIDPNADQPRGNFRQGELEELAESLRRHGVIQPLILRSPPENSQRYQIIAGERRWRAAQIAGLHAVPAILRELEDQQVIELAIIENVQRVDLDPVEEARGYTQLVENFGYTQEQLAGTIGKSRSHVANTMRDRKSTRLNSSHVAISYAVFCLKKKIK